MCDAVRCFNCLTILAVKSAGSGFSNTWKCSGIKTQPINRKANSVRTASRVATKLPAEALAPKQRRSAISARRDELELASGEAAGIVGTHRWEYKLQLGWRTPSDVRFQELQPRRPQRSAPARRAIPSQTSKVCASHVTVLPLRVTAKQCPNSSGRPQGLRQPSHPSPRK